MTPEERAADIMERCWAKDHTNVVFRGLSDEIVAAIHDAVEEEREACAKIAEDQELRFFEVPIAIMARGKP